MELSMLEQYLLKLKWENDVRIPIARDFYFIDSLAENPENKSEICKNK